MVVPRLFGTGSAAALSASTESGNTASETTPHQIVVDSTSPGTARSFKKRIGTIVPVGNHGAHGLSGQAESSSLMVSPTIPASETDPLIQSMVDDSHEAKKRRNTLLIVTCMLLVVLVAIALLIVVYFLSAGSSAPPLRGHIAKILMCDLMRHQ